MHWYSATRVTKTEIVQVIPLSNFAKSVQSNLKLRTRNPAINITVWLMYDYAPFESGHCFSIMEERMNFQENYKLGINRIIIFFL